MPDFGWGLSTTPAPTISLSLPALSGILLIGPLISSLASFNVFGGSAANVAFTYIALLPTV